MSTSIITIKPKNQAVLTTRPANLGGKMTDVTTTYLENKTIRKGEPMGLLLSLTYPTTITFVGPRL